MTMAQVTLCDFTGQVIKEYSFRLVFLEHSHYTVRSPAATCVGALANSPNAGLQVPADSQHQLPDM